MIPYDIVEDSSDFSSAVHIEYKRSSRLDPVDQWGPVGTSGDQWGPVGTSGTVKTSGTVEQWVQRTSGTVGAEDQWNSGYRGPEEQWVQRTRGTVGTEDQLNSEYRGQEE